MSHRDNYNESGPHLSHAKEDKKSGLSPIDAADWTKTIGKTLVSKDGLDMGKIVNDREVERANKGKDFNSILLLLGRWRDDTTT